MLTSDDCRGRCSFFWGKIGSCSFEVITRENGKKNRLIYMLLFFFFLIYTSSNAIDCFYYGIVRVYEQIFY